MLSLYAIFSKKNNDIFVHYWGVPSTSYRKHVSDKNLHFLIHIKYLKAEKKVAHLNGKQNLNQLCLFILCIITQKIYIVVVVKKGNITNTYRVFNSVGFLNESTSHEHFALQCCTSHVKEKLVTTSDVTTLSN